jgi:predicted ATPase with chaperone activity
MRLAKRVAEALETTRIHRVAGRTGAGTAVVTTRPCRAPHYTISDVGLSGGGRSLPWRVRRSRRTRSHG